MRVFPDLSSDQRKNGFCGHPRTERRGRVGLEREGQFVFCELDFDGWGVQQMADFIQHLPGVLVERIDVRQKQAVRLAALGDGCEFLGPSVSRFLRKVLMLLPEVTLMHHQLRVTVERHRFR